MIICGVVFLLQIVVSLVTKTPLDRVDPLTVYFGATGGGWWQIWRYVTFQFLHSTGGIFHIALNMLGLYFLGTPLEQRWGGQRFLRFYLTCGVVAGIAYVLMTRLLLPTPLWGIPLVGASGGVYGVLLACAILFPHIRLILFIFPVPIRLAAAIVFGGMIFVVLTSLGNDNNNNSVMRNPDFWSQVAHLGGAVAAAVWIWVLPKLKLYSAEVKQNAEAGAWEKKVREQQAGQAQIDRILDKIQQEGISSLTGKEKRILQDATEKQREEDKRINRM
ncbi:MAG: rhomboid family intramembrane serine protease [Phycisphaerae bacterium]|nr:rhomboid family intramembrane serine protease [Phycisphaerae bacterium]